MATLQADRSPVVVKLVPKRGTEASKLDMLTKDPVLGVVPILAHNLTVCTRYSGIVTPRLDTFYQVLEQMSDEPTDANADLVMEGLDWLIEVLHCVVRVIRRCWCV
jgi:hypothetical protein